MADQQMSLQSVRLLIKDEMENLKNSLVPFIRTEIQSSVKEASQESFNNPQKQQTPSSVIDSECLNAAQKRLALKKASVENSRNNALREDGPNDQNLTTIVSALTDKIDFLDKKFDLEKTANAEKLKQIKNNSIKLDLVLSGLGTLNENINTMFKKLLSLIVEDEDGGEEEEYEDRE